MYETRMVRVGNLTLGGHNPVWVQSMTNTDTRDAQATASTSCASTPAISAAKRTSGNWRRRQRRTTSRFASA